MNKKKVIIVGAVILVILCIGIYLIYFYGYNNISSSIKEINLRKIGDNYFKRSNINEAPPLESTYSLDPMKFMAKPEGKNETFISITVVVSYTHMDSKTEQEIILKRYHINRLVKDYISQRSYTELNSADKRKKLRRKLYFKIKKIMKNPILNVYFKNYMHSVIEGQEE